MIAANKTSVGVVRASAGFIAAALLLGTAYLSVAAEPAPTLDQLLTQAMDRNPGIVAAKARVASAEAELKNTRFEVARQLVACWNEVNVQVQAATAAGIRFARAREEHASGRVDIGQVDAAENSLIDTRAKLARARSELEFLIGRAPPAVAPSLTPSPGSAASRPPLQVPHGPMVENVRRALGSPSQMEFVETPLSDVVDFMKDQHHIEIQIDKEALKRGGWTSDLPITMNLKAASLAAMLQFWDDNVQELKLVVRDYGILVTTPERANEAGYMPVVEFIRLAADAGPAVGQKGLELTPPGVRVPVPTATKRPVPAKHESPRKPKTPSNDPF
jgi:hypothetical protein